MIRLRKYRLIHPNHDDISLKVAFGRKYFFNKIKTTISFHYV